MLPQSNNLFAIQQRFQALLAMIQDAEGEINPEIDQALQISQLELQEAAVNIGFLIKGLDYNEEVIKAEIDRLTNLKHKTVKSKDLLKTRLSQAMQQFGIERIEHPTIKLSFRRSEAVEITDEMELPAIYFDPKPPVPNKIRIKEAIKAGETVEGAELVERKNLVIK